MDRIAFAFAILAAWGAYRVVRFMLREFDSALFRQAIERVPVATRDEWRASWMTEEGIEP
jgi:hypothetical protein